MKLRNKLLLSAGVLGVSIPTFAQTFYQCIPCGSGGKSGACKGGFRCQGNAYIASGNGGDGTDGANGSPVGNGYIKIYELNQ